MGWATLSDVLLFATVFNLAAVATNTFCNPLNLDYRFAEIPGTPHREAADPTMVVHNSTYWLFASKSGGYWHSKDLDVFEFVTPTGLPIETYAPMVVVIDEVWYYTAFGARAIYWTRDPYAGHWQLMANMNSYSDPGMLVDDDGKVYMYSGCSDNGNIQAIELDAESWQEVGSSAVAVTPNHAKRGYEVGGDNNELLEHTPYVEGAFMNKINGTYVMQYAVPGTQYKSYADGIFTSSGPLGPFTLHENNPFSHKPTGFAAGAGHSSTFASIGGNVEYYHVSTISISVRHEFERRLGIYPVLSTGGHLATETYLGDYPQPLPALAPPLPAGSPRVPAWMLLTYKKNTTASSVLSPEYSPDRAVNEDIRSWWSAKSGSAGEWFAVDLDNPTVYALQVSFADQDCQIKGRRPNATDAYKWHVEWRTAGSTNEWLGIPELDRRTNRVDRPHDYVELLNPLKGVAQLRITADHMPGGGKFSISGFRAFGIGVGVAPPRVLSSKIVVQRDATDQRHATVSWDAVEDAQFYVVRYGVSKSGLLSHNYQVYDATEVDVRALIVGVVYDFAVDAVGEGGVTLGDVAASA